jgi:hypothetical protein
MSYCNNCNRAVAREDRVEVDGAVYHRSCAPDEVGPIIGLVGAFEQDEEDETDE